MKLKTKISFLWTALTLLLPGYLIGEDIETAIHYYKSQNYEEVIQIIRKLHEEGKNSFESHALCAHAYNKLGNFESAFSHFQQALKFKPDDPNILADRIRLCINFGKIKQAIDYANAALEKHPQNKEIRFLHSYTLFLRGKPKTALARVEKLKSELPDDPEILNLEGKIYYSLGNYEKADLSLKWASALQKDSPSILNNLALVHEKMYLSLQKDNLQDKASFHLKEAKENIQKAVSLDAKNPTIAKNAQRILAY